MTFAGFTDPDPSRENEMVLIIDNESGTYGPVWYHLARAAEVLRNCGGGLTVLPLDCTVLASKARLSSQPLGKKKQ